MLPSTNLRFVLLAVMIEWIGPGNLTATEPAAQPPQAPLRGLVIFPQHVRLDGPRDRQQLIVLGEYADGQRWDLTRQAIFTTQSPKVALVEAGVVRPVSDGPTTVTVQAGGRTVAVPVEVERAKAEMPVEFAREIVPTLTKLGCNQGACHGSQHGKNGFRLSLLGFEPEADYTAIVKSAEARRITPFAPEESLILLKPSLSVAHGGGKRMEVGSAAYRLLTLWLEGGA